MDLNNGSEQRFIMPTVVASSKDKFVQENAVKLINSRRNDTSNNFITKYVFKIRALLIVMTAFT